MAGRSDGLRQDARAEKKAAEDAKQSARASGGRRFGAGAGGGVVANAVAAAAVLSAQPPPPPPVFLRPSAGAGASAGVGTDAGANGSIRSQQPQLLPKPGMPRGPTSAGAAAVSSNPSNVAPAGAVPRIGASAPGGMLPFGQGGLRKTGNTLR